MKNKILKAIIITIIILAIIGIITGIILFLIESNIFGWIKYGN